MVAVAISINRVRVREIYRLVCMRDGRRIGVSGRVCITINNGGEESQLVKPHHTTHLEMMNDESVCRVLQTTDDWSGQNITLVLMVTRGRSRFPQVLFRVGRLSTYRDSVPGRRSTKRRDSQALKVLYGVHKVGT